MDTTSRPARYVTLRDYLRVLRRYWIAIVLIAAIGAAAGLADAKSQTPVYTATASVAFQDPAQDLPLVGLSPGLIESPGAVASATAETITRPQIMARVKQNLRTDEPVASLAGGVSGAVTTAGLLEVSGSWSNPAFAARLTNSVAAIVVAQANRDARKSYATAASDVRRQIVQLGSPSGRRAPGAAMQAQVLENTLARLVTLSHFAQTAQLARSAQAPTSASSPKTTRSAIIGLVLGLALAILLAFVRDAMDRRLKTTAEVESSFELPILGHVRKRAMGKVAQKEALTDRSFHSDVEAFRILRRNIEFLNIDSPPRSVVVTSALPEEGKTTVAASLALAMASAGKRTLLIDCDLRRPDLATRLEIERAPGLSDYLMGEKASTEITHRVQVVEAPSQNGKGTAHPAPGPEPLALTVVPAGTPTSHAAELLGSRRFRQFIEQAAAAYEAVVMDSSPLLPVADTLEMLPAVDAVVVCARESKTRREDALAVRSALERVPNQPVGVVITGIKPGRSDYSLYSYSYGYA